MSIEQENMINLQEYKEVSDVENYSDNIEKKISLLSKNRVIKNKFLKTTENYTRKSRIEDIRQKLKLRQKYEFQEEGKENEESVIFQKKKLV